ncbi:hypothetical protein [Georgenia sp. Z1491]|uniref:hypothetical protein n=1 Tax=Georgenia sp. Z1491 TaxID=3416707 RepID=UPI003CFBAAD5
MPTDDDRGPSPAQRRRPSRATIWRRRITVLLALLVVLALIVWGIVAAWGALFGGDDDPGTAPADAAETSSESGSESASDAAPAGDPVACTDDQLDLALTGSGQYAGAPVEFAVDMSNSGEGDCLVDAGQSALVLEVSSGNDQVWSSAHCPTEESRMLLLGPGTASESLVTWPGTRSSADCPEDAPAVQPGTYRAVLLRDGTEVVDSATVFTLEEAPPEAPTDGEEPSDGEDPAEGEAPADGETPAEGEAPTDGETPTDG